MSLTESDLKQLEKAIKGGVDEGFKGNIKKVDIGRLFTREDLYKEANRILKKLIKINSDLSAINYKV